MPSEESYEDKINRLINEARSRGESKVVFNKEIYTFGSKYGDRRSGQFYDAVSNAKLFRYEFDQINGEIVISYDIPPNTTEE